MNDCSDDTGPGANARAESILHMLEAGASGDAPDSLLGLPDAWLAVAIVEAPGLADSDAVALVRRADEAESIGRDRWALALALPLGDVDPQSDPIGAAKLRHLVDGVRILVDTHPDALAAIAVDRGRCGAGAVLGPAPHAAGTLFARARNRARPAVWLDAAAHGFVGEPAAAIDGDFRLMRRHSSRGRGVRARWWATAALAAGLAAALLPGLTRGPDAPLAQVYVVAVKSAVNTVRGGEPDTYREGDEVHVRVIPAAGSHVTLLLLGSDDRLQVVRGHINVRYPVRLPGGGSSSEELVEQFELDNHPGRELFVVVVAPQSIDGLSDAIENANAVDGLGREERLVRLEREVERRAGESAFRIVRGAEIRHVR